jgi:hypothetical protein
MPFVGNILRGVGAIPVQGKGKDIKLIKKAMKILQAGGVLGKPISGSKKIKLTKKILEDTVNSYMKEIY